MSAENIYTILSSKPHNPHYLRRYIKFIEDCSLKNKQEPPTYTERHHICPKAKDLFPEYTSFKEHPWNICVLSGRQHLIAHYILTKAYPNSTQSIAIIRMLNSTSSRDSSVKFNRSRLYENCRKLASEKQSAFMKKYISKNGHPKGMLGKSHTEEFKRLHCIKFSGENNPMYGKSRNDLSESNKCEFLKMVRGYSSVVTKRKKSGHFDLFNIDPDKEHNPLQSLKNAFLQYCEEHDLYYVSTCGRGAGKTFVDYKKASSLLGVSKRTCELLYNLNTESPFFNWSTRTYSDRFSTQTK